MPKFSVIITCFNAAGTICETLSSVENQSFSDFEVIVIDDGSEDRSGMFATMFAERDERFRVIRIENQGPSRARNLAVNHFAKGDYYAFLDADDIWHEDKLLRHAEKLEKDASIDALYARVAFFSVAPGDTGTLTKVKRGRLVVQDLLGENPTCTLSNVVVKAEAFNAIEGFDEGLSHSEDLEWLMRLVVSGSKVLGIDECLTYYRNSDTGLSSDLEAMHKGWLQSLLLAQIEGIPLTAQQLCTAEANHLIYLARRALRLNLPRGTALDFAVRALRIYPSQFWRAPLRSAKIFSAAVIDYWAPETLRRTLFTQ